MFENRREFFSNFFGMLFENMFSLNISPPQYLWPKFLSPQYLWQVYAGDNITFSTAHLDFTIAQNVINCTLILYSVTVCPSPCVHLRLYTCHYKVWLWSHDTCTCSLKSVDYQHGRKEQIEETIKTITGKDALYCIVFVHLHSASLSMSLSEVLTCILWERIFEFAPSKVTRETGRKCLWNIRERNCL